jgi:alpha-L-rhamnosidase
VRSSHKSVYGEIVSDWKRENGKFHLQVKIPCNTEATVVLPNGDIHEVGSGTYDFKCTE